MEALRVIGSDTYSKRIWAVPLIQYSLKHGYDQQHGGFFMSGKIGEPADDKRKEWWVQAEALVGLLELYRQTKDLEYWRAFKQTLNFIEKHQLAPGGGWYATLSAEGKVISDRRATMWQGPYHTGRALLRCAKELEALAKEP